MANGDDVFGSGWSIPRMVEKLWQDAYHGNGKPGITTRLKEVEDALERLQDCKAEQSDLESAEARVTTIEKYIKEKDDRLVVRVNQLIAAVLALAGAVILQFIFHGK